MNSYVDKINRVLGHKVSEGEIVSIFNGLGFEVSKKGDHHEVTVPTYRATKDIEYEADLTEEIGRMIGYDNITPVSPPLDIRPTNLLNHQKLYRKIRNFLTYTASAYEVFSYPMVGEKLVGKASWPGERLQLVNALSEDHDSMRTSLVPSMLDMMARNQKNFDEFRFYELGRTYQRGNKSL